MPNDVILITTGLSPQVVTETLFAARKLPGEWNFDRIVAVTTANGKRTLEDSLSGEKGQLKKLTDDYMLPPVKLEIKVILSEEGEPIEDIHTSAQTELMANQICRIVERLAQTTEGRILASIAGGRKNMGVYLAFAMQLFARPNDIITHVIISPQFEGNPQFFYPPKTPTIFSDRNGEELNADDAEINLMKIPFVPLHKTLVGGFPEEPISFTDYVVAAGRSLEAAPSIPYVRLNLRKLEVTVGDRSTGLTPTEAYIYWFFLARRQYLSEDCVASINDLAGYDRLRSFFLQHINQRKTEQAKQRDDAAFRPQITRLNTKLKELAGDDKYLHDALNVKSTGRRDGCYLVNYHPDRIRILDMPKLDSNLEKILYERRI